MWPVKQLDKILKIEGERAEERVLRLLDHDKVLKEKLIMSAYIPQRCKSRGCCRSKASEGAAVVYYCKGGVLQRSRSNQRYMPSYI